jgi:ADP-heptose:LPS heptosyltransferase
VTAPPPHRVLVLRALGLGDLLTVVPALRALRRCWPPARLVLACPASLGPVVRLAGTVDAVLPATGLDSLPWTGTPPDVAVNLHGRGPRSHRLLAGTGARRLLGYACPEGGHVDGPPWDDGEHEVVRWCRMLQWYGLAADPADLRLDSPRASPRARSPAPGAVVVHPGAAYESRCWPAERYAAVARARAAAPRPVVVTGTAAELARAEAVAALAGLAPGRVLAGRTDLATLAALVAEARLVLCGDTGVGHLATACGTPSVLLFGPTPPALWGPPADPPIHRVLWKGHCGDPWASVPDPGLLAITPGEVISAAADLLDADLPSRPVSPCRVR